MFSVQLKNMQSQWLQCSAPKPPSRRQKDFAKRFLKIDFVRDICQGPVTCDVKFGAFVIGRLTTKADELAHEVLCEYTFPLDSKAWIPRIKIEHSGTAQYASLGGFVCTVDACGTETVFNLTAGHVLPAVPLFEGNAHPVSESDDDDNDGFSDSEIDLDEPSPMTENDDASACQTTSNTVAIAETGERNCAPEWRTLGHISPTSHCTRARDRDWALIDLDGVAPDSTLYSTTAERQFEAAQAVGMEDALIHISNNIERTVSKLPARAILPSGDALASVDMQVLDLAKDEG